MAAAVRLGRAVVLLFVAASCLAIVCLTCCTFLETVGLCAGLVLVAVIGFVASFLVVFVSLDMIAVARLGLLPVLTWSFVVCDSLIATAPRFGLVSATEAALAVVGDMVELESLGDSVEAPRFSLPVVVAEAASVVGVIVDVFADEPPRFGLVVFVDVGGVLILDSSSCVATPRLGLAAVLVDGVT